MNVVAANGLGVTLPEVAAVAGGRGASMKRDEILSQLFEGVRAARPPVTNPAGFELISSMQTRAPLRMATSLRTVRASE